MWEKIKAFFTGPRLIDEFKAIQEKVESEVVTEIKKPGRKKKK